ncbi:MAG TPA: sulfite exporter TauE/SafE family protein [Myxococcales bacterium]|nr:sulfite exporter TauE/SafE family protein [Myxococcales bacterium]
MSAGELAVAAVAFVAAAVSGGLGYGFSSLTVPVALLVYAGRALNPALVLLELFINALALFVNRGALRAVWPRMPPLLSGAVPGVVAGSLLLARTEPGLLKLGTFAVLLPLILLQSAGIRRPFKAGRKAGASVGLAVGTLYGATTLSGPPLALLFNNQGLARDEFRAALGIFRLTESALTAVAYAAFGLFTAPAVRLAGTLAPGVLIGVPLGYLALRRIAAEPFRRACMAADALLVGFGLARTTIDLHLLSAEAAYTGLAAVVCVEAAIVAAFALGRAGKPELAGSSAP